MSNESGYIYVVSLEPMGMPGYKIGMTKHLQRRMNQLGVPAKGTLSKWWYVNNVRECEKMLHSLFKEERVPQSEWFKISEAQLKTLVTTVRKWRKDYPRESKQAALPKRKKEVLTTSVVQHNHVHSVNSSSNIPAGLVGVGIFLTALIIAAK